MSLIKKIMTTAAFMLFVVSPVMALAVPQFASADAKCDNSILAIPPWYRGLTDAECNIVSPSTVPGGLPGFIWIVVLNVIEIGLYLAGVVALLFIFFGGFLYLTGGSNPSQIERARKTLLNAVIGLVISMASIALVKLIFRLVSP